MSPPTEDQVRQSVKLAKALVQYASIHSDMNAVVMTVAFIQAIACVVKANVMANPGATTEDMLDMVTNCIISTVYDTELEGAQ